MAIHDKITTNKWTYERSHKSLNSYSLVKYNKIYPNTNSRKNLQEESSWEEDFDKTHQGILVWNRNKRLHTKYKKHVHKERKEITHVEIGERRHTSSYIYISKISTMYVNMVTRLVYKKKKLPLTRWNTTSPYKGMNFSP